MINKANMEAYIYALESVDLDSIGKIADDVADTVEAGGNILVAGNGGSHAIAQHLSCDLIKAVGFKGLCCNVSCLTDNTAILTAISNDIGYNDVLSLQVEQLANMGYGAKDVLIAFSVSGRSRNIIQALNVARLRSIKTVSIAGLAFAQPNPTHSPEAQWRWVRVSTGHTSDSPIHYYTCETAFSAIAHEIARLFHIRMGNYA